MVTSLPDAFLWGVAASAYQIEGAVAEDGRSLSIWDTFSAIPGKTARGESGAVAIDHYHRLEEDVALMAELGVNAYRFSISWPRLIPGGVGDPNPAGIDFYRRLCSELAANGIEPLATLYHWDLPQSLQDEGGWQSPESVAWFSAYAATAQRELGDRVALWTTHNEPWCAAFLGHGSGAFAPGVSDPVAAFTAAHHLMVAHHRAVEAMRAEDPAGSGSHGIVLNLIPARPGGNRPADSEVASTIDAIHNELFLLTALEGRYPESIERLHDRFGISSRMADLDPVGIDFLGVNYYNINRFTYSPESSGLGEFPGADGAAWATPPGLLTEMGWGVEPEGLGQVLDDVSRRWPELPLFVTENGAAYPDLVESGGQVADADRIAYLDAHIAQVEEAIARGVDVRGYFAWSMFDNFEWALGYEKRFGLVRVDYDTLERSPKASFDWYRERIATSSL